MRFQYDDTPYFYQYQSLTQSKDIARELMDLELQTEGMLKMILLEQ
jgi:hypothetical protein